MMVSGSVDSGTEKVFSNGQMVPGMRGNGKTIGPTVKENSLILTATSTMVIGSTIKPTGMVYTIILTELCMRGTGEMIFSTVRAKRAGPMAPFTKVSIWPERNTDSVSIAGMMDQNTKENGTKTRSRASELTAGSTEDNTRESGLIIIWTEWESTLGLMADVIWESIKMTRSTGMVFTSGLTAACTSVNGCAASNTASESTRLKTLASNMVSGRRASV